MAMEKTPYASKSRFLTAAIMIAITMTAITWFFENYEALFTPRTPPELKNFQFIYGKGAPLYTFENEAEETVQLSDFEGKLVLLNFWATWCGPCKEEMPALNALAAEMAGEGLAVAPVSFDMGKLIAIKPFYQQQNLTALPILMDADSRGSPLFELRGLPTTFLIAPDGKMIGKLEGAAPWTAPAVKDFLRQYLPPE